MARDKDALTAACVSFNLIKFWYTCCDDTRLLWIKGDPGKGTIVLLITIVNELEKQLEKSTKEPIVLSYLGLANGIP